MEKTKTGIRIVVAGDRGTGKSSLIATMADDNFRTEVPPVLPPTTLPEDFFPDYVPITIIDTSSRVVDDYKVSEELKRADVVVFTYACDEPSTFDRLTTFWLPKLSRLEVKVPVVLVGCKLDLRGDHDQNKIKVSLKQMMSPIMEQFLQIGSCVECSALKQIQIPQVFYYAQTAVLHPRGPLLDHKTQALRPRCLRALRRIFTLCDHDGDGALSDEELNDFQLKCYDSPLQPFEIIGIKKAVAEELPEGVNGGGLTRMGFLLLHVLFIRRGHPEAIWTVLRTFGYNSDIRLAEDLIPSSFLSKRAPDQSVELTNKATDFLRGIAKLQNSHTCDGELGPDEINDIFSIAAEIPWETKPYADAAQKKAYESLSLDGFLSMWDLMTLVDPALSMENLIYLNYPGDLLSAFHVTKERRLDREKQRTNRNVFQSFVFGPKKAGKSALLDSFLERPFSDKYTSTNEDRYAVNVVDDEHRRTKKTLVLKEIPEDEVSQLLLDKQSLAACDVAVFVHDSSNAFSWERATEMLVEVANHGENTGFRVPCLIVATKYDLVDPYPMAIQNYIKVSKQMGIDALIPISTKLGGLNDVFRRIVKAAEHPHLNLPKTEAGRSRQQY